MKKLAAAALSAFLVSVGVFCMSGAGSAAASSVTLSSVSPSMGDPGTALTLSGSGFAAAGNTVHFDSPTTPANSIAVAGLPSADGKTISLASPQLANGGYVVWVETSGLASNYADYTSGPLNNPQNKPIDHTIQVTLNGTGSGVVSAPGMSCSGNVCTGNYPANSGVTLSAVPNQGSLFTSWSNSCSGTSPTCIIGISTGQVFSAVIANFGPDPNWTPPQEPGTGGSGSSGGPAIQSDGYNTIPPGTPAGTIIHLQSENGSLPFTQTGNTIEIFNSDGVLAQVISNVAPDTNGNLPMTFNPSVPSSGYYIVMVTDSSGSDIPILVRISQSQASLPPGVQPGGATAGSSGGSQSSAVSSNGSGIPGVDPGTGLVPCEGLVKGSDGKWTNTCDFKALVTLVQNVINWLFYMASAIAAACFAVAGYKYVTAAGDTGKIRSAHTIFRNVVVGLIIALSAWLLINTIVTTLVGTNSNYSLLQQQ